MAQSPSDININSLTYSQPRTNTSGGQTIFVNQDNVRKPISIVLPKSYLPFGISDYNGRYSLQFSLKGDEPGMCAFKDFLNKLDLNNVQKAVNNSTKWFQGKTLTKNVVQELYNPSMKQNNDKYPPMFRAKFPVNDSGFFTGDIYDKNKNIITQGAIVPGCELEVVVQLVGLYFVSKEFGVSWKVIQIKVHPNTQLIRGYAFIEDEEEMSDAEPN
jgi:hypothetical protein